MTNAIVRRTGSRTGLEILIPANKNKSRNRPNHLQSRSKSPIVISEGCAVVASFGLNTGCLLDLDPYNAILAKAS